MGRRLFAAVLPPQQVVNELDALLAIRREVESSWRWTPARNWHLTTAFMADVADADVESLEELLAEVAERTERFELQLTGARCFPDVARAKLLAMAVGQGSDALEALALRCRGAATRAGAQPDGARFVGHLTLARANRGFDASKWAQVVESFGAWSWQADELVLVESHLAERRYEVIGRWPLLAH